MAQVFISYSRADLMFVEQLANDLKEAGFDVWYDLSRVRPVKTLVPKKRNESGTSQMCLL